MSGFQSLISTKHQKKTQLYYNIQFQQNLTSHEVTTLMCSYELKLAFHSFQISSQSHQSLLFGEKLYLMGEFMSKDGKILRKPFWMLNETEHQAIGFYLCFYSIFLGELVILKAHTTLFQHPSNVISTLWTFRWTLKQRCAGF